MIIFSLSSIFSLSLLFSLSFVSVSSSSSILISEVSTKSVTSIFFFCSISLISSALQYILARNLTALVSLTDITNNSFAREDGPLTQIHIIQYRARTIRITVFPKIISVLKRIFFVKTILLICIINTSCQ